MSQQDKSFLKMPVFSPELNLLLDCCKLKLGVNSESLSDLVINRQTDWKTFLELTGKHRIYPLVNKALLAHEGIFPEEVKSEISRKSTRNLKLMMKLAGELLKLHTLFQEAGIDFISYKGPLMVHQIFGDFSDRQTRDIDILITENNLVKAIGLLAITGFKLIDEYFSDDTQNRNLYLLRENHLRFTFPEQQIILELHWTLSKYFTRFETEKIFEQAVTAEFMGKSFKTLPLHLQFVFLCTHGIYHQFDSLFWLFDIAWIIKNKNPGFNAVLLEAEALKSRQAVVSSVFLAHYFFGIPIPESCPKMNRQERFLFDQCVKNITGSSSSVSHTKSKKIFSILNQRVQWLKYQMLMTSDFRSRKRILFLKMIKPYVWHKTDKIPSNKIAYLLMTQIKWLMMLLKGKITVDGVVKTQKSRKVKE